MNEIETEEKFSAIIIAIQNGNINIARRVFDFCINSAANEKLDQAISLLRKNGYILPGHQLDKLKNDPL